MSARRKRRADRRELRDIRRSLEVEQVSFDRAVAQVEQIKAQAELTPEQASALKDAEEPLELYAVKFTNTRRLLADRELGPGRWLSCLLARESCCSACWSVTPLRWRRRSGDGMDAAGLTPPSERRHSPGVSEAVSG
jgi:hypothetical protein